MTISVDQFREGMRGLAASVTILATANDAGKRVGMTATAVCSVTGDPPTLLCCISRDNQTRDFFVEAGRFSANVLPASDEALATRFAMRISPEERFAQGCWSAHRIGVPVLDTASAWFACKTVQTVEIGSHTIFFGQIEDMHSRGNHVMPLLYAHGGYGEFSGARPVFQDLMWTPDWQVYD